MMKCNYLDSSFVWEIKFLSKHWLLLCILMFAPSGVVAINGGGFHGRISTAIF